MTTQSGKYTFSTSQQKLQKETGKPNSAVH
jgi:hypothetical protein